MLANKYWQTFVGRVSSALGIFGQSAHLIIRAARLTERAARLTERAAHLTVLRI